MLAESCKLTYGCQGDDRGDEVLHVTEIPLVTRAHELTRVEASPARTSPVRNKGVRDL